MSIKTSNAGPNIDISFVDILTMPMRIDITGATACNAGGSAVDAANCFQKTKEGDTVGCWGAVKHCDPASMPRPAESLTALSASNSTRWSRAATEWTRAVTRRRTI